MAFYIFGAIFIICGFLLGKYIEQVYATRIKIIKLYKDFLTYTLKEINLFNKDLSTIINEFSPESKYKRYLFEKKKTLYIKEEFQNTIENAVTTIKNGDRDSAIRIIEEQQISVGQTLAKAEEDYVKKGKLFYKLMPLICVGIVLLLI